ncbi:hypothetical protein KAT80_02035 [Candidatus Pacearchaeota archaeon]|nr:hypothetical protein [Candidatus Pacearchaeota archaeon]
MGEIDEIINKVSPYYKAKAEPEAEHKIVYDSSTETLEPVYFWILDFMNNMMGLSTEKLVDNFTSSPGSGHFGELGQRATVMQQQGQNMLAQINTILRSVLNIIYDLKEFKIRLQSYDDLKSEGKKEAARQSLKQIWLDKVDMQKGNSSIKAMALGQAGFQTLLDAFLVVNDIKGAEKLDLNDRVKRIVSARIHEFNIWLTQSEIELRKRYEMERIYLGSQVNSLKLYSRWAKPYLKAAQQLEMKESKREPALVKTFNTILLELTLLGKDGVDVKKSAIAGDLPTDFQKLKTKRDYYSCVLVDFNFRGIPQRVAQRGDYAFGGRAEVTFKAYALNSEELDKLNYELDKSDIGDVLKLIEGSTSESLDQLQKEIDFFLKEKENQEEKEKPKDQSNPFLALIGHYDKKDKSEKQDKSVPKGVPSKEDKDKDKPVKPDNWIEKTHLRAFAAAEAVDKVFTIFDVYKKSHGMESFT